MRLAVGLGREGALPLEGGFTPSVAKADEPAQQRVEVVSPLLPYEFSMVLGEVPAAVGRTRRASAGDLVEALRVGGESEPGNSAILLLEITLTSAGLGSPV